MQGVQVSQAEPVSHLIRSPLSQEPLGTIISAAVVISLPLLPSPQQPHKEGLLSESFCSSSSLCLNYKSICIDIFYLSCSHAQSRCQREYLKVIYLQRRMTSSFFSMRNGHHCPPSLTTCDVNQCSI